MYKIKHSSYVRQTSNGVKLTILTIAYFLLSSATVFAHEGEENITVISEADWVGPLVAVLIIVATVVVAKIIKKGRKN